MASNVYSNREEDTEGQIPQRYVPRSYNKENACYNAPSGVLALHIKKIHILQYMLNDIYFIQYPVRIYLRICIDTAIKTTQVIKCTTIPTSFIIDEMIHFGLGEIIPKRSDDSNKIRFELVIIPKMENDYIENDHMVFGSRINNLIEMIETPYHIDIYELREHDAVTASVELEYCFSYGTFGYGFSNMFEISILGCKSPEFILSHSLFFRPETPAARLDVDRPSFLGLLKPKIVGHPPYINFTKKVHFVGSSTLEDNLDETDRVTFSEPVLAISQIRQRVNKLQQEFSLQNSRSERIDFMKKTVFNKNIAAEDDRLISNSNQVKLFVKGNDDMSISDGYPIEDFKTVFPQLKFLPDELTNIPDDKTSGPSNKSKYRKHNFYAQIQDTTGTGIKNGSD